MRRKRECFVIMPVSKTRSCSKREWTNIFKEMIRPAVTGSRLSFTCERAKPRTGSFVRDILNELNTADVVIADLTDMNPNVYYELGVRHTLRNRTILIAQDMKYVPSDLQSYWVVAYKKGLSGLEDFKQRIREILREMIKNPEKPDSPVFDFLTEKNISLLSQEKVANLKKLAALVDELDHNTWLVNKLLKVVRMSEKQKNRKGDKWISSTYRFDNACLTLLLSTWYIKLPREGFNYLRTMNMNLSIMSSNIDLWSNPNFREGAVKNLKENLPQVKSDLSYARKQLNIIRHAYMNDNYQEEPTPIPLPKDKKRQ